MQGSQVRFRFSLFFPFLAGPFRPSLTPYFLFFRAGRYDSAERHSKDCLGFHEISLENKVYPVKITKREHQAIVEYRTTENPSAETADLAVIPVRRLLVAIGCRSNNPALEAESLDTVKYILLLSFLESRLPRSHILYMISHFFSVCSVLCV